MRRNRWTSFPGDCCGGSAAKSRTRSDAVGFRKGHRRAGAFRPDEFPSRKITDCRAAFAIFAGVFWVHSFFPKTRTEVTGTPVRTELVRLDRADSRRKLGLREDLPTLLVMGGSQGASGINQALIKVLPFLQGVPLQVIHLSGARDERLVADNYRRENVPAYIGAFHHQMEEVYSAADLVVARAGAASLAEFAGFSLPGILIPFPYAADDHQTRNAEIYARADAAILLKQSDLSGEVLARNIRELMENPQRLQQMAANCARLAPNDAAGRVANTMEKYTTHEAHV